jgi:hypothetical protein
MIALHLCLQDIRLLPPIRSSCFLKPQIDFCKAGLLIGSFFSKNSRDNDDPFLFSIFAIYGWLTAFFAPEEIMSHFPSLFTVLSCLSLVACGAGEKDEDSDSSVEFEALQPQVGDWTVVAAGWTDDDCNATNNLTTPTSLTVANVEASTFSMTVYDGETRIGEGNSTCTHDENDVYTCEEMTNSFSYTDINMAGVFTASVNSETTMSISGTMVLECTGSDCNFVEDATNTGSLPCNTTLNISAEAN